MFWVGPISSIYDLLTFWVLVRVFRASEALFHTGWFIESLATQTLVIFVIRTAKSPFKSKPSRALALTTVSIVVSGIVLPYTPIGSWLGFTPVPASFFAFLALAVVTYLVLVEIVKRTLFRRALA
jgi:Mg2+-importing ATPase